VLKEAEVKMPAVEEHLKEKLRDPHFRELHELDQQKLAVVKKVVDYRIRHKLSQGELAERVGVSQQHISKIENGVFSSVATLEKVLRAIGYTVRIQIVPIGQRVPAGGAMQSA
jgi:DNA-binding XRE family transcriptional regulator